LIYGKLILLRILVYLVICGEFILLRILVYLVIYGKFILLRMLVYLVIYDFERMRAADSLDLVSLELSDTKVCEP